MSKSVVDYIYRRIVFNSKFFVNGWGDPAQLNKIFRFRKVMSDSQTCYKLVDPMTPVKITQVKDEGLYMLYQGHFLSPFNKYLPNLMPEETKLAHFQMLLPHKWKRNDYRPVCIHLAGTGDHGFWKRRSLTARPLLEKYGIGSILLENPYYGLRKPPKQTRSCLRNVSDLFVMGGSLIMECAVLMHWCNRLRVGPVGLSGISMGGHMASLAACSWPKPVPLIPCLSWTTASGVFTQGVMSGSINWDVLRNQYLSNEVFRNELFNLIQSPEGHFAVYHEAGQLFAKLHSDNLEKAALSLRQSDRIQCDGSVGDIASSRSLPKQLHRMQAENNVFATNDEIGLLNLTALKKLFTDPSRIKERLEFLKRINYLLDSVSFPLGGTSNNKQNYSKSSLISRTKNILPIRKSELALRSLPFNRKNSKSKDPHLSFTPIGVRPSFSKRSSVDVLQEEETRQILWRGGVDCSILQEKMKNLSEVTSDCQGTHVQPPRLVRFTPYTAIKDAAAWETFQFMRGVMDECTHVGNFGMPADTELIIIVRATKDAYVPGDSIKPLNEVWPGSELRTVDLGHVTAFLLHQDTFRQAINDAFLRMYHKYRNSIDWTHGGLQPLPPELTV